MWLIRENVAWLTGRGCLAFADGFHDADHTARLKGGLEPIGRVLHVGHVYAETAIFTQQYHGGALLLVACCVTDCNHVLNLRGRERIVNLRLHPIRIYCTQNFAHSSLWYPGIGTKFGWVVGILMPCRLFWVFSWCVIQGLRRHFFESVCWVTIS